jgi:hypothetical protein
VRGPADPDWSRVVGVVAARVQEWASGPWSTAS